MNLKSTFLIAGLLAVASAAIAQDTIAILAPTIQTTTLAGQENQTFDPLEAAKRVIPRFQLETTTKLNWARVEWTSFERTFTAQQALMGTDVTMNKTPDPRTLRQIGKSLGARYVVSFTIRELTGYRATGSLIPRKGGRANISVQVFDTDAGKFVWQDQKIETSTREQWTGSDSLRQMQDQALFNALRKALEPFVEGGQRKEVVTEAIQLIAKSQALVEGGKRVLLDLGSGSGIQVGDSLISLDGKVELRVVEVFGNGTLAEVVVGTPSEGGVYKTKA